MREETSLTHLCIRVALPVMMGAALPLTTRPQACASLRAVKPRRRADLDAIVDDLKVDPAEAHTRTRTRTEEVKGRRSLVCEWFARRF